MGPYKVVFLDSTFQKKKWHQSGRKIDGLTISKELQALCNEQDQLGYDLFSIVQCTGSKGDSGTGPITASLGFLVTFKVRNNTEA